MFFKRFIRTIKQKWLRKTTLTILLIAIIVTSYFAINILFKTLNLTDLDLTQNKLYTLSEDSKTLVKNIKQNVTIYLLGYEDDSKLVDLVKQYNKVNENIRYYVISAIERPDLMTKYSASTTSQIVAVEANSRYKTIDASELYTVDYSTYSYIDVSEQKITNAIMDVTITNKPKVYFLMGHNEFSPSNYLSALSNYIENDVNDVDSLNLLTTEVPEECDLLIICDPTQDFEDIVTEKIENYIENGGNILWLQNPGLLNNVDFTSFTNINKILSIYGVSLDNGIVCEQALSSTARGQGQSVIPGLSYNKIVKDLYTDGTILMEYAGKIVNDDDYQDANGITVDAFVYTSDESFYVDEITSVNNLSNKPEDAEEGPFILGEVATKQIDEEKDSKLVVYSNAIFVTNVTIATTRSTNATYIEAGNNKDLALNSVAFLTERDDTIRIRKDTGEITFDSASISTLETYVVLFVIFLVPVLIIISGIVVAIVRRRRK